MLGRLGLGFNRLGIVGGKHGPPIWVPLAGSTAPTLFADFITEGGTNHYWYNGAQQANAAAWLTAVSGTFSRASAASYTNSSGLLASASSGALRFDYDPVLLTPKGILLEGASTNLLIQSSTFTNVGAWTQVSSSTVSQNATGPDGVANSATTYSTIENNTGEMFQAASQVNGTYTYSLYVKKSGTSNFPFICIEQTVGGADFAFAVFNLGVSSTATQTGVGGGDGASRISATIHQRLRRMTLWKWSQTAATNASADGSINWAEGETPAPPRLAFRSLSAAAEPCSIKCLPG
jgi:hypothetical protein